MNNYTWSIISELKNVSWLGLMHHDCVSLISLHTYVMHLAVYSICEM